VTEPQPSPLEIPDALRDEMRAAWHRYLDLVEPLRGPLHAYCHRLTGNLWDAEDLAQDTLMKGFGTLGGVHDPIRNPRAYLLRMATNVWIDRLRRRDTEEKILRDSDAPDEPGPPPDRAARVRDAGTTLLEALAPRERAALVLKEVFDLSLEESADVLETTVGAVKAALHRARTRLRDARTESPASRARASEALVDRFVALFNAGDKRGLVELVLDNAAVDHVGVGYQFGRAMHEGKQSWFEGAVAGHPDWPERWQFESQRAERASYEGEPIAVLYRTRRGREALEGVVRLEEQGGRIAHMRAYSFCPETTRAVADALGVRWRGGPHRYPTPGTVDRENAPHATGR
jgi:RNA polymerase sigma-70 factor (ECF subfamily)